MLEIIKMSFPSFQRVEDAPNDTSKGWKVPGFLGQVGFSDLMWDDDVKTGTGWIHHLDVRAVLRNLQPPAIDCWREPEGRIHICCCPLKQESTYVVLLFFFQTGTNQVCLFGNAEVSLRDAIRQTTDDAVLKEVFFGFFVSVSQSWQSHQADHCQCQKTLCQVFSQKKFRACKN